MVDTIYLIWFFSKSRISLDTEDMVRSAKNVKAKADATAGKYSPILRA